MRHGSSTTACLSQLIACSQGGVLAGAMLGLIYVFQEKLVCAQYFQAAPSARNKCIAQRCAATARCLDLLSPAA